MQIDKSRGTDLQEVSGFTNFCSGFTMGFTINEVWNRYSAFSRDLCNVVKFIDCYFILDTQDTKLTDILYLVHYQIR